MPPSLLPQMLARAGLSKVAHSALPNAPVRPHTARRLSARRVYTAVRERLNGTPASVTRLDRDAVVDCAPSPEERARVA